MRSNNERDFIGYGSTPPDPRWPNGARLALVIVLNVEEGAEPSIPDGDPVTETAPDRWHSRRGARGKP
ncbi:MAG: hypothetical protein WDN50_15975 [Bradyrhizobium sp.]